jgi:hypothetical protein
MELSFFTAKNAKVAKISHYLGDLGVLGGNCYCLRRSSLRGCEFAGDGVVEDLLKNPADGAVERFEFDGDAANAFADNMAAMGDIDDFVAQFEFQRDVDVLAGTKQAFIGGQEKATEAPILDRKSLVVDDDDAAVIITAGKAALRFRGVGIAGG